MCRKVSIIIPCFNAETTIDRCLQSIYIQDYDSSLEVIVVDDGSTDSSKTKICEWITSFEKKGHVLKYVYQENRGPGGAVNTGLKYVTGYYLSLLDADDCFLQGSIKKRVAFLNNNPEFAGVRTNGWQDNQGIRVLFDLDPERTNNTNLFDGLIGGKATNWAGSYMVKTDILFGFYPTREIYPSRFGQHMQILLPVAYKNKFGYIDEPLMIYFLQNNSHSKASTQEEQEKKNDYNFYGYQDIYNYMIDLVIKDKDENNYYKNIVKSWVYKHELHKATQLKNKELMNYYYKLYKSTGRMTLNEEIEYYSKTNLIKVIILKIYRRLKCS